MSVLSIVRLGSGGDPRKVSAQPYRRVTGTPTAALGDTVKDEGSGMTMGMVTYQAGVVELMGYPADEYCFVVEGEVSITDVSGARQTFRPGDAFMIPRGFKGLWEMPTQFRKGFVVFDPHAEKNA